ncbi:TPA: hypothetical protein DEP96_04250 [Candidatus Uhrbacteria bacterium]|nr:hypothetical protein [Candidatus Uhrbacteria bacterium]
MSIESGPEGEKHKELEKPPTLNIFSDYATTIAALRELEGDSWLAEEEFSSNEHSLGRAYNAVLNGDPERSFYGKGGVHRFFIDDNGLVYYSKMHGSTNVDQAKKLGLNIS